MMSCEERLAGVLAVTLPVVDILEQRALDARAPEWCEKRGWTAFLLELSDEQLATCEAHGLAAALPELAPAPANLVELARAVTRVCELPRLDGATPLAAEALRSVRLRKRAQLGSLLAAVAPMASGAQRIVDVGAGSGHFTRLSAELFERDALGLEHNPARVAAARQRSGDGRARFVTADARSELPLFDSDLAIGLHACGELGDELVRRVGQVGCDLALISCCLQKISKPLRAPLASELTLRREHLGLTNLTAQPRGVETTIEVTLAARQTRYALGLLLRARGLQLEAGAEMSGINRRRAQAGLRDVAERALALRGLAPPTEAELAHHQTVAAEHYARIRRLSLPRSMLSRLVEVLVSLDRAAHLERTGLAARVVSLFDRAISPRNIAIFASREPGRLPAA